MQNRESDMLAPVRISVASVHRIQHVPHTHTQTVCAPEFSFLFSFCFRIHVTMRRIAVTTTEQQIILQSLNGIDFSSKNSGGFVIVSRINEWDLFVKDFMGGGGGYRTLWRERG